jgi:hypothetical protein
MSPSLADHHLLCGDRWTAMPCPCDWGADHGYDAGCCGLCAPVVTARELARRELLEGGPDAREAGW